MNLRNTGLFIAASGLILCTAVPAAAATRVVDSGDGQGTASNCGASAAAYFSIQAALTASIAGDTIVICPGTGPYNEQLSIDKSITLRGTLGATIRPAPLVANSTSLSSGNPIAAAILVEDGVSNVVLDQLTIDGSGNAIAGCSPNPIGVYYRNASGTVKNSVVKNVRLGAGLEGCQSGLGIFVQSGGVGGANVTVSANIVHDFQKNGITGNEAATVLTATGNYVTGDGPTPLIAQNGIQIGFNATGAVTNNLVSEVVYSQCVDASAPDPNPCDNGSSTGILVYQGSGTIPVTGNTVTTTQTGVYLDATLSNANSNLITRTRVYDGIYLPSGADNNTLSGNIINNSDEAGIWVDGTGNTVTKNRINEAPIGIRACAGNTIGSGPTKNTFLNVLKQIDLDPCVASISTLGSAPAKASPAR